MIKHILFSLIFLSLFSCNSSKNIADFWDYSIPNEDFNDRIDYPALNYSDSRNWLFHETSDDYRDLLPKNYDSKNDSLYAVSVFYIHPTTLYHGTNWNADTNFFRNESLIQLCAENQASVFAGITKLYAPHYREMHIYSYTDTVNGYKAFDVAYKDVRNAFKFFAKNNSGPFIIASHSQGTNHAVKLIQEEIAPNKALKNRLILSYLIGMDVKKNDLNIHLCEKPNQLDCFLTWRGFDEGHYPSYWDFGDHILSVNPITFKKDTLWSNREEHMGILFINQKIRFKKTIRSSNHKGMLWVRFPKNRFFTKFRSNDYHKADYNLYWMNIRENLKQRLSSYEHLKKS